MIVYNVTVRVDAGIERDWLTWAKDEHIQIVSSPRAE
ncbi:MAG: DUF4286 family protein [Bacteroidetes bacterium]|nr:MAG: DUF4286 family protein [Bacteroidota bacterium]